MITLIVIFALLCVFVCIFEFVSLLFNWSLRRWIKAKKKRNGEEDEEDVWIDFIDISDRAGRDHDHDGSRKQQEDR